MSCDRQIILHRRPKRTHSSRLLPYPWSMGQLPPFKQKIFSRMNADHFLKFLIENHFWAGVCISIWKVDSDGKLLTYHKAPFWLQLFYQSVSSRNEHLDVKQEVKTEFWKLSFLFAFSFLFLPEVHTLVAHMGAGPIGFSRHDLNRLLLLTHQLQPYSTTTLSSV